MAEVLDFSYSDPSIALSVRTTRNGPENALTEAFIDNTVPNIRRHNRHYALFCEPQIDTGFPDIVLATYNPSVFENWSKDRDRITTQDLKLLHHLHFVKGGNAEEIEAQLGISSKPLVRSLERLMTAGLIRWNAKKWIPIGIKNTFAISSLIAIEAKIKNWSSAFQQAKMNRWFASETYVLSPVEKPQEHIVKNSERSGIGIYCMSSKLKAIRIVTSKKGGIPSSYASWQFNEWIGRRLTSLQGNLK
ncbi:MAG: hypothetical protein NPIRA03_38130 [Nitrospirales bacterium]|nr:MAG: hypothetical protein NPIRA03_38130 [Nitrospirales bacterium]